MGHRGDEAKSSCECLAKVHLCGITRHISATSPAVARLDTAYRHGTTAGPELCSPLKRPAATLRSTRSRGHSLFCRRDQSCWKIGGVDTARNEKAQSSPRARAGQADDWLMTRGDCFHTLAGHATTTRTALTASREGRKQLDQADPDVDKLEAAFDESLRQCALLRWSNCHTSSIPPQSCLHKGDSRCDVSRRLISIAGLRATGYWLSRVLNRMVQLERRLPFFAMASRWRRSSPRASFE